jgi:ectoine hydroxylase-related dioxygenase (phytanoyl-CoA dioxygenase family)
MEASLVVAPDLVEAFRRDGAVCIRGALSASDIALAGSAIERNLAEPSSRALVASRPDDPGRFFEDFCNWQRFPELERLVRSSPAAAIAGALMAADRVRFFHDHVLVKEPGTEQRTPWHQDQPYYNVDGAQTCSVWVPVDPVSRASTLEFVAGSHRGPWLMPRTFMDNQAKWFPGGTLEELPDIESDRSAFEILGWALEPGDAVFFNMLTLHCAGGVDGTHRRRALSLRFLGDDVTHAPREWKTSPDFPGLADELAAGAPLDHLLFPIVWERAPANNAASPM